MQKNLKIGDLIVCEKAIRDEGTSHHYLKASKYAYASKKMTERIRKSLDNLGQKYFLGTSWTVDAPYRETVAEAKQYQKEGYDDNTRLTVNSVQIRKCNSPELNKFLGAWWYEVKNKSYRDQLSFCYAAWKLGYKRYRLIDVFKERLKMIAKLAEEPQHAYALAKNLGISYPLAHLHLKGLKKMGLIEEIKNLKRSDALPAVKIYAPTGFELVITPQLIQEKVNYEGEKK